MDFRIMVEMLACFDKDRMKEFETGRFQALYPKEREQAHVDHTPHLVVRVFAIDRTTRSYLTQKRGPRRTIYPNKYTDSASGHVVFRENFQFEQIVEDAKRELHEEMGIEALVIEFWKTAFSDEEQELGYLFLAIIDQEPCPDPGEVAVGESRLYTLEQLRALFAREDFIPQIKTLWEEILAEKLLIRFIERWNASHSNEDLGVLGPGVFIGRFQPFHCGHLRLLQEGYRRRKKVILIIGSAQYSRVPENPFTISERTRIIQAGLRAAKIPLGDVEIKGIEDKHDAPKWADEIRAALPPGSMLFSNSEWIRSLFAIRGVTLGEVMKFEFESYNGTAIRKKMYAGADWAALVPAGAREEIQKILSTGTLDSLLTAEGRKC